jgi:hypothetical protein
MVTQQAWEFCELALIAKEEEKGNTYYELELYYLGPAVTQLSLSTLRSAGTVFQNPRGRAWNYNPWHAAIGLLGMAGWELVGAQYGTYPFADGPGAGRLYRRSGSAFFKRPVMTGRPIDQPAIVLP